MRHLLILSAILFSLANQASGKDAAPFSLSHFGHFKKMMHSKNVDGVVNLKKALDLPHIYAVGATAGGTGEITVIDNKIWLDYGADGLGNAKLEAPPDEMAVLLVRAQVDEWLEVKVPQDMNSSAMHAFIIDQAQSHNINTSKPFPFLLEGNFYDLDWHVVNGLKSSESGHKKGGIFKKEREHRNKTKGTVIGFYSAASQGVYTHPGESWHLHVVFEKEEKAGHIDAISVRQGTLLQLPIHQSR